MAQTKALVNTLKIHLKANGKKYIDVAEILELSEASVKRLFAEGDFSLSRLDKICQMLNMEISDLVNEMNVLCPRLQRISEKQEMELTQDLKLLLVAICVFNGWSTQNIIESYKITEAECIAKLIQLERLNIIELLQGNRVKLLISPNFQWHENGPIQRFFQETIGKEYFNKGFDDDGERLVVLNGMLSSGSYNEFHRKLERLAREFNELNNEDNHLPFEERKAFTVVLAMRQWGYGLFNSMVNNKNK